MKKIQNIFDVKIEETEFNSNGKDDIFLAVPDKSFPPTELPIPAPTERYGRYNGT